MGELVKKQTEEIAIKQDINSGKAASDLAKTAFKAGKITFDIAFNMVVEYMELLLRIGREYRDIDGENRNQYSGTSDPSDEATSKQQYADEVGLSLGYIKELSYMSCFMDEFITYKETCYGKKTWPGFKEFMRELRKYKEKPETPSLPDGKFRVIYADPAWPVGSIEMDKWESPIDDKYSTMTIEDIKNLKIRDIADEDCSLFLWTTHTFLPDCFEIMKEWGFKYFCCITWNKGSGWTQNGFHKMTELLLYAYKGKMNIDQYGKAIPTLIDEAKTYHSKKPDSIRDLIRSKTPEGRIELFARDKYEGWTPWGNEV